MACLKDLDNIHGKIVAFIKVILNKAFETDMEFGQTIFPVNKIIKVIICQIKSMDLEYMTGQMDTIIREVLQMTKEMDKVNYILMMILFMKDYG